MSQSTQSQTWKERLNGQMREDWAREIDVFETQIELRKKGKFEEKMFAETRLRRGIYGQRYDNGQRHDGESGADLVGTIGQRARHEEAEEEGREREDRPRHEEIMPGPVPAVHGELAREREQQQGQRHEGDDVVVFAFHVRPVCQASMKRG